MSKQGILKAKQMQNRSKRTRSRRTIKAPDNKVSLAHLDGLLDEVFYLSRNADVAESGISALEHFFHTGFSEGRDPNFYFHCSWYTNNNKTLLEYSRNPLLHYVLRGEAEGQKPSPYFDPVWYRKKYGLPPEVLALRHFLQHRVSGRFSPTSDFDAEYYLFYNPDIVLAGIDPFEHFINQGMKEGRRPNASFISSEVTATPSSDAGTIVNSDVVSFPDEIEVQSTAYLLYQDTSSLSVDRTLDHIDVAIEVVDLEPTVSISKEVVAASSKTDWRELSKVYFDEAWYRQQSQIQVPTDRPAFEHWWNHGRHLNISPHPLFIPQFYAEEMYPSKVENKDLFLHFLHHGQLKDSDPHPCFSMTWYRDRYTQRDNAHPWIDYLEDGKSRNRQPNWLFSSNQVNLTYGADSDGLKTPLEYYLLKHDSVSCSPHPLLDMDFVSRYNPDISSISPYFSFWKAYRTREIRTHSYFDPKYYSAQLPEIKPGQKLLAHYIVAGEASGLRPIPLFFPQWHNEFYERSDQFDSSLEEFAALGELLYRHPCPGFDPRFYLETHSDVARAGKRPLQHFMAAGQQENRATHLLFDIEFYADRVPLEAQGRLLQYWLFTGRFSGDLPHPAFHSTTHQISPDELLGIFSPILNRGSVLCGISTILEIENAENSVVTPCITGQPWLAEKFEQRRSNQGKLSAARLKRNEPIARHYSTFDSRFSIEYVDQLNSELPVAMAFLPLVSVIIPTKNRVNILSRAIRSALSQTHRNLEVIIVDDGGWDGTEKLIENYFSDPRVIYKSIKAGGVSAARNEGLRNATGDFIAYLDSDNYWEPRHVELTIRSMVRQGSLAGYSVLRAFNASGAIRFRGDSFDLDSLQRESYIDMNVYIHSRVLFDEGLRFDETLRRCVDWDFILRAAQFGDPLFIPIIGCNYIDDTSSLERITTDELSGDFYKVCQRNINLAPHITGRPPRDNYRATICWSIYQSDWKMAKYEIWEIALHCQAQNDELIIINNALGSEETNFLSAFSKMTFNVRVIHLWRTFKYHPAINLSSTIAKSDLLIIWRSEVKFDSVTINHLIEKSESSPASVFIPLVINPQGIILNELAVIGFTSSVLTPVFSGQTDILNSGIVKGLVAVQSVVAIKKDIFVEFAGFSSTFAVTFGLADFCIRSLQKNGLATELYLDIRFTSDSAFAATSSEKEYLKELEGLKKDWLGIFSNEISVPDLAAVQQPLGLKLVNRDWILCPDPTVGGKLVRPYVKGPLVISVRCPAPNSPDKMSWGDFHYATAMVAAIEKFGHRGVIELRDHWDTNCPGSDIVLHLRGIVDVKAVKNAFNVVWVISHPEKVHLDEYAAMDVIFVAGPELKRQLWEDHGLKTHILMQATDQTRFCGDFIAKDDLRNTALFVGNSRLQLRPIVVDAIKAGLPIKVYGGNWENFIPQKFIGGNHVDNLDLASWYGSSGVVLNDHWKTMKEYGIISNRIFDAVATGRPVITDVVGGLEEFFYDAVSSYTDETDLLETYKSLSKLNFETAAKHIRAKHTIEHRIGEMLSILQIQKR